MHKLLFATTLTLTLAMATAACTEPDATIVDVPHEDQATREAIITVFGSTDIQELPDNATEADRRNALIRYGQHRASLIDALSSGGAADEVDDRVRSVLQRSEPFPYRAYVEQYAACRMLEIWLTDGRPEALAQIGHYTSTLLRHDNPDASLLLQSLTALRPVWSEERIRNAARKTIVAATRWTERVCPDCHAKDAEGAAVANPALMKKRDAVGEATGALELLAGL